MFLNALRVICLVVLSAGLPFAAVGGLETVDVPVGETRSALRQAAPCKLPVVAEYAVRPSQVVSVQCRLSVPCATNDLPRAALLSVAFMDAEGRLLRADGLQHSSRTGAWAYVPAADGRAARRVELRAPARTAKAMVRLSPFGADSRSRVEAMDVTVREASLLDRLRLAASWKIWPWVALLGFPLLVAATFLLRGGAGSDGAGPPPVRRLLFALVSGAVVSFAVWSLGDCMGWEQRAFVDFSFPVDAVAFLSVAGLATGVLSLFADNPRSFVGRHPVLVLSLLFLGLHVAVIQFVDGHLQMRMSSDFYEVQRCLQSTEIRVAHQPFFSYWCNHELLLSVLGKVFGPHLQVGQVLNALCCVGVLYPVFWLVERVSGRNMAVFTCILVGAYPTNYLYATLLTSEYLCTFLLVWAFFFLDGAVRAGEDFRRAVCLLVLAGVCLGLAQLAKPFGPIFLAAAFVLMLATASVFRSRAFVRLAAGFVLLAGVFLAVSGYVQGVYAQVAEPQKVVVPGGNLTQTLVKGLDLEGRGRCSAANARLVKSLSQQELSAYLAQAIRRDYASYPLLFAEKFARVHASEQGVMDWFSVSVKKRLPTVPYWLNRLVQNYYLLVRVLFLVGALGLVLAPLCDLARTRTGLFAATFVCGFAALLLVVEAHGRYRVPVYPFTFIVISYSHVWLRADGPVRGRLRALFAQVVGRIGRSAEGGRQ